MIELKIIGAVMFFAVVIFGGGNRWKRWKHRRRMARNEKFKRKFQEAWKRRFLRDLEEIQRGFASADKRQNIVVKDPKYRKVWGIA